MGYSFYIILQPLMLYLIVSVAIKLYHSDKKLVKMADNIWSKRFSEVPMRLVALTDRLVFDSILSLVLAYKICLALIKVCMQ